jgi:hypothetical protein
MNSSTTGAKRALAKCALAMCFNKRVPKVPVPMVITAGQMEIPTASWKRLERDKLIVWQKDGWHLTTEGEKLLRTAGIAVPKKIVRRGPP